MEATICAIPGRPCGTRASPQQRRQPAPPHRCRRSVGGSRRQRGVACSAKQRSQVTLYDTYDRLIPYEQAWQVQKDLVDEVAAQASLSKDGSSSSGSSSGDGSGGGAPSLGALLLLQHPPVYTLGAGATEGHLKFDPEAPPHPLYRTERGGEVTYHGPGQLVLYPILALRRPPLQPDLHWYLRRLEEVVIRTLDSVSGLQGERIPGLTGVWVEGRKVAALGVRASRWVTYHGLAFNVAPDLAPFRQIVPCGIADRPVGSVQGLLEEAARRQAAAAPAGWQDPLAASFAPPAAPAPATQLAAVAAALQGQQQQAAAGAAATASPAPGMGADALLEEYRYGLLDAFEEVFEVELRDAGDADLARRLGAGRGAPQQAAAEAAAALSK